MQVICAFLDAKTTMQHIFDEHNATCLLLAQREVNSTTCCLFLAKWHTMQLTSMTCLLPSRKDKHCDLIPPCSPKCRPYNLSHACSRKTAPPRPSKENQHNAACKQRKEHEVAFCPSRQASTSHSTSCPCRQTSWKEITLFF